MGNRQQPLVDGLFGGGLGVEGGGLGGDGVPVVGGEVVAIFY